MGEGIKLPVINGLGRTEPNRQLVDASRLHHGYWLSLLRIIYTPSGVSSSSPLKGQYLLRALRAPR